MKSLIIFNICLCTFTNSFAENRTPNLLLSNDEYQKIHDPGRYYRRKQAEEVRQQDAEQARQENEKKMALAKRVYQNSPEYWATVARIGKSRSFWRYFKSS